MHIECAVSQSNKVVLPVKLCALPNGHAVHILLFTPVATPAFFYPLQCKFLEHWLQKVSLYRPGAFTLYISISGIVVRSFGTALPSAIRYLTIFQHHIDGMFSIKYLPSAQKNIHSIHFQTLFQWWALLHTKSSHPYPISHVQVAIQALR